jgi:uncharacterized protein YndB with AHSA1/START domain
MCPLKTNITPDPEMHPIHLEMEVNASPEKVWKALTEQDQLKQWYFDFEGKFKAERGHEFTWEAGPPDGKQWLHKAKVLEVVPEEKLSHTWAYPGYSGQAILTWKLKGLPGGKTLVSTRFGFTEPFDPSEESLSRKNFLEGWKHIVLSSLREYVTSALMR